MKGKAAPVLVYEVGEELGTREAAGTTPAAVPRARRRARARARAALEVALSGEGGVVTVEGAAGIGSTRLAREALDAAGATQRLALRAEPYGVVERLPGAARPAARAARHRPRHAARRWVRRCWRPCATRRPGCCRWRRCSPTCVHVGVPGHAGGRPGRPAVPRRPGRRRRHRAARPARARAAAPSSSRTPTGPTAPRCTCWAGSPPPPRGGPGRSSWCGAAGATASHRHPAPASCSTRCRPTSSSGSSSPPPRRPRCARTRSPPSSPRPAATRCSSRRSPALALGAGSLDELPESVQAAMGAQVDELPPAARRILRYCAVLGLSVRREVLEGTLAADGLALDPATLATARRPPRGRRPGPAAVPHQPGARRRLRRAGLPGAGPACTAPPARCSSG